MLIPLIASAVAGAWDALTGEIPEAITIPLIVSGLVYAWLGGFPLVSLAIAVATLIVGYALYYTGQLGGGDVLLISGISAWFPTFFGIPSPLILFLAATIAAAIFYSAYYLVKLGRPYVYALIPYAFLPLPLLAIYALALYYYVGTAKREDLFVVERDVEDLLPEDVLAEDVPILPPGRRVLGESDIERLKKAGVKRVKILVNLPRLGPFIFIAFVALLLSEAHPVYLYACGLPLLPLNVKLGA